MSINTDLNSITNSLKIKAIDLAQSEEWDNFVKAHPDGHFMQSSAWANFKELEGYQTFRYGFFVNQSLVGGCLFYCYSSPNKINLLFATGGPILMPNYTEVGMQILKKIAENLSRKLGIIALRIEPLWITKPLYLSEFVRAPVDLIPSETLLINLCSSEAERLANMKQKGRYNLRLCWRYGVETEFTTDPQFIPVFYDLFWETVKEKKFWGEPYSFFINLCQTLFQAKMAEIGLARWQGKILAAIIVVYWGQRATYLYGGRSFQQSEMRATYGLHWAAMQRAKERGCCIYDFYGFTENPHHSYAKFSQFKRQFGGTVVTTIGAYDYFFYDQLATTLEERNVGAALVEAGYYIANGLILSSSLAGDSGSWVVGLICWLIGLFTLAIAIFIYPKITTYNVFAEIKNRNNAAAGVALMGFLIAIGNIVRVAFRAEFQNWITSFIYYGLTLIFCLLLLAGIRWFADLILVSGVKITDEIVRQEVPNLGAGLIEAFTYIAASFLIAWTF